MLSNALAILEEYARKGCRWNATVARRALCTWEKGLPDRKKQKVCPSPSKERDERGRESDRKTEFFWPSFSLGKLYNYKAYLTFEEKLEEELWQKKWWWQDNTSSAIVWLGRNTPFVSFLSVPSYSHPRLPQPQCGLYINDPGFPAAPKRCQDAWTCWRESLPEEVSWEMVGWQGL